MSRNGSILLVEDDDSLRQVAKRALERAGLTVKACAGLDEARHALGRDIDCVVTDLKLPDGNGMALVEQCRADHPGTPVILVTAYADLDAAVGAFSAGAFDYLPKPFDLDELVDLVRRALAEAQAEETGSGGGQELLGRSRAMQPVFRAIGRLARSALPVLITGATGTGKELVARALHRHGSRREHPFVAVNLAAIPRELLEAELFGHEKGAFTGAHTQRPGRFEQAGAGTLFLDEVGDMPEPLQTRLLRVLSEGEYYRVGGSTGRRTEARIIAATHQDLQARVQEGTFREDLLHRLDVVELRVPPLAERVEDVEMLARHFLNRAALENGVAPKRLHRDTLAALRDRPWPGNVRQLENLCRRLTALTPGPVIYPDDLPPADGDRETRGGDLAAAASAWFHRHRQDAAGSLWQSATGEVEQALIREALRLTGGERQKAAELLGMSRNTLSRKLKDGETSDGET